MADIASADGAAGVPEGSTSAAVNEEVEAPLSAGDKSGTASAAVADDDGGEPDLSPNFAPLVELHEVETKTGEEDERVIFRMRSKLFRFNKELSEWKERGTGDVRLLQHKENQKIRILMRREKTLKICLNHFVNINVELTENVGSDRSWVFHAIDYADGERDEAMFAIRFANAGNAKLFREAYESAQGFMRALLAGDPLPDLLVQEESNEPKGEKVADAPARTNGSAVESAAQAATGDSA